MMQHVLTGVAYKYPAKFRNNLALERKITNGKKWMRAKDYWNAVDKATRRKHHFFIFIDILGG